MRVRYFASLRERKGIEEEQVELLEGETLGALYLRLCPPIPGGVLPVAYARNLTYAGADEVPDDGDEISFLPPIGGG
ncbi:MAG TPA: MoaD/ThiS family protein [Deltaproteobacteria bacterium]|nr:MoaD/ThiS family protein [Deltaproteobacteria bacterium]